MSEPKRQPEKYQNLSGEVIRGAAWMVSMRWVMRLIGLGSTVVLARLLAPEDFGLIAMVALVTGFLTIFADAGVELAVIRLPELTPVHLNTAWTIRLILKTIIALAIISVADPAAQFFAEDRLYPILLVSAGTVFIDAFGNMASATFRQQLLFRKDFIYNLIPRAIGAVATIILAIIFRNYWALVIGTIFATLSRIVTGYVMSDNRPSLSLQARKDILGFSLWIMIRDLANFFRTQFDQLIIARYFGAQTLGPYYLAGDVANMLSSELVQPLGRALLPGYAKVANDKERLQRSYRRVVGAFATFTLPITMALAFVAEDFVTIVFGPKWIEVIPLLQILIIGAAASNISSAAGPLLMALGKAREVSLIRVGEVMLLAFTLWFAAQFGESITAIAWAKTTTSLLFLPLMLYIGAGNLAKLFEISHAFIRPLIATSIMVAAMIVFHQDSLSAFLRTGLDLMIGGFVYIISILFLWRLSKHEAGIEFELVEYFSKRFPLFGTALYFVTGYSLDKKNFYRNLH
ncbi:lipopolysaccharide biosynthesis protein [Allochromatium palmeri]|uniref:Oligosaccharide flippase family protein n=1 Tax=Allochromatium palmeri TaxID=231048 RepID=A0A6N8ED14_9GAMM|nr:lipopolysaccharide biosynthesis protein [Allochromatium palmeri]MTW21198.1 oligosaccharide flippase family protein [Allochromatium palmeri]